MKEKIFGIGLLDDVAIYGDFVDSERRIAIRRSPYYLCPFVITDGSSHEICNYFNKQEIKSYMIGTCFVGLSGLLLYSWKRTRYGNRSL